MNPLSAVKPPSPAPQTEPDGPARGAPSAEFALVLIFLAIIASAALIQAWVEIRRGERLGASDLFRAKPTSANLRAYERSLEDASLVGRALRPWFQLVQFAFLKDGGEKVLVGKEDWLFYRPGCDDYLRQPAVIKPRTNDAVAAIVAWRDALSARGMHLLVVPAPNKESIYPDQLTRRAPPGRVLVPPATRDLLSRLTSAGVECVDLFALFASERTNSRAPLYLAQDTHWSPAGVELAARAVARRLLEKGWVRQGETAYQEHPAPVERTGDLLRMLDGSRQHSSVKPPPTPCVQVIDPAGKPYQDNDGSPVLVLGDSFLRIYQQDEPRASGFIAHLAKELKQPVTSLVNDGGASTLVRKELHRRPALLANKRVVVWEFVERDIRLGTEGWEQVPLPR